MVLSLYNSAPNLDHQSRWTSTPDAGTTDWGQPGCLKSVTGRRSGLLKGDLTGGRDGPVTE